MKTRFLSFVVCFAAVVGLVFPAGAGAASGERKGGMPAPLSEKEKSLAGQLNGIFHRAAEQVMPAVVYITVAKEVDRGPFGPMETRGLGSGFIIDKRGYVLTNNHVVKDTDEVTVFLADGRQFKAKKVMLDPDTDLALVEIDAGDEELPVARFGDSEALQIGDFVLAIGSPFGLKQTVTVGTVSYLGRQTGILDRQWGFEDFIQTDAAINKGNSGGPLVNLYGEVVGINSNILSPTGVSTGYGFAIPSNLARFVADELIKYGKVRRGYLGVRISTLSDLRKVPREVLSKQIDNGGEIADRIKDFPKDLVGVLVTEVQPDTPAEAAGIEVFDVFTAIDGQGMETSKQLRNYIATRPPGTTVKAEIWRDGQERELEITLGDRRVAKEREQGHRRFTASGGEGRGWSAPGAGARPKLGVSVRELDPDAPEWAEQFGFPAGTRGVVIESVIAGSLAEQNGLQPGEIIVSVNGTAIDSIAQLREIINKADLTNKGVVIETRDAGNRTRRVIIKAGPD